MFGISTAGLGYVRGNHARSASDLRSVILENIEQHYNYNTEHSFAEFQFSTKLIVAYEAYSSEKSVQFKNHSIKRVYQLLIYNHLLGLNYLPECLFFLKMPPIPYTLNRLILSLAHKSHLVSVNDCQ